MTNDQSIDGFNVVNVMSNDELEVLVKIITEKGSLTEFLSVDDKYKKYSPNHQMYKDLIIKELSEFGGNSIMNLIRGNGPAYKEILCDVCDKLKVNYNNNAKVERIENSLLEKVLEDSWENLSDSEREELLKVASGKKNFSAAHGASSVLFIGLFRAGGFASYKLALIIANAVTKAIIGRGLSLAINAGLVRSLAIISGPIGWLLTGIWTAVDIAGAAYRVTVPSIIYIVAMRQIYINKDMEKLLAE